MSFLTKISSIIATAYPAATFLLSSKFSANLQSYAVNTAAMPLIILNNELTVDAEIKKNNNIALNRRIVISFLNLDSVLNTDTDTEVIRDAMETMAIKIASIIWQLPEVVPSGGNQKFKITPAFHVFNTDLSGVILEMQTNENTISNICAI